EPSQSERRETGFWRVPASYGNHHQFRFAMFVVEIGRAGAFARNHQGANGCSVVHSFPNSLQSAGFSTPFKTSPHCEALGSVTRTPGVKKCFSASQAANESRIRSADCEMNPNPRHSKYGRSSNTSPIALRAARLPSQGTTRAY